MVISILKLLIILFGILATIWYLIAGLRGKDNAGYKKAGTLLILTFLLISILSVIQQKLYPRTHQDLNIVLSASREAPVGQVQLKLYKDTTYAISYGRSNAESKGSYQIKQDTLTLFAADTIRASFIIRKKVLKEVTRTGIGGLKILEKH